MNLILETDSGTGANIASELALGEYTATATKLVGASVRLSDLNAAAATFTLVLRHKTSADALIREFYRSQAKRNASDTAYGFEFEPVLMKPGEKLEVRVVSTNAGDTNVAWAVDWVDPCGCGDCGTLYYKVERCGLADPRSQWTILPADTIVYAGRFQGCRRVIHPGVSELPEGAIIVPLYDQRTSPTPVDGCELFDPETECPPNSELYTLTDCNEIESPIVTTTELFPYIGQIIEIVDYPGVGWEVTSGGTGTAEEVEVVAVVEECPEPEPEDPAPCQFPGIPPLNTTYTMRVTGFTNDGRPVDLTATITNSTPGSPIWSVEFDNRINGTGWLGNLQIQHDCPYGCGGEWIAAGNIFYWVNGVGATSQLGGWTNAKITGSTPEGSYILGDGTHQMRVDNSCNVVQQNSIQGTLTSITVS